ncbi:polysaccharide deacetylase family protein, partial [Streptomyces lushanensis]|uniref:polysaccharide deacetylase family protein n=1 Tax=Streptomyces lushanensis TaxID=1434255 RepID=UPI000835377D
MSDTTAPAWLSGAAAVALITFDVDAEAPILALNPEARHDLGAMSHQCYGPDVAVPRILDLLDDTGVPATFFIPGAVAESRPHLARSITDRGHEVAHHTHSHRPPTTLTPAQEREDFIRALDVFHAQDITIHGYRAANWQPTNTTLELVAEHGLYDSSLMGDDRPYTLTTPAGSLVELPVHWSLDDWEQYAFLPDPHIGSIITAPHTVLRMWTDELDAMRRHRALFNLTLHPELSGRPSRLEAIRSLIEHAQNRGDVHFARCHEVATHAVKEATLP